MTATIEHREIEVASGKGRGGGWAVVAALVDKLRAVEEEINGLVLGREEAIRAVLVALVARQHIVLLGPPGTSKSRLVELLAARVADPAGGGLALFDHLMMRSTKPDELFGAPDIAGLKAGVTRRVTTAMLPEAELVFLDEIFKGSSAILNTLLKLMQERAFHNPHREAVPLVSLIGASNELPQGEDTAAIWDRFLLRVMVDYVDRATMRRVLDLPDEDAPPVATLTRAEMTALQRAVEAVAVPDSAKDQYQALLDDLAGKGIVVSDRRKRQALRVLKATALIEGRRAVEEDDFLALKDVLWQAPEQRQDIARAAGRLANPYNQRATDIGDEVASVVTAYQAQAAGAAGEQAMLAAVGTMSKLKELRAALKQVGEEAQRDGRGAKRVEAVRAKLEAHFLEIANVINM